MKGVKMKIAFYTDNEDSPYVVWESVNGGLWHEAGDKSVSLTDAEIGEETDLLVSEMRNL